LPKSFITNGFNNQEIWDNDHYVATVHDFDKELLKVVRYYQYFKGEYSGTSLGKKELLLWIAQCLAQWFRNFKILNAIVARMLGANKF
jgi:hypothetical protein